MGTSQPFGHFPEDKMLAGMSGVFVDLREASNHPVSVSLWSKVRCFA
jgi:hypothetical protein